LLVLFVVMTLADGAIAVTDARCMIASLAHRIATIFSTIAFVAMDERLTPTVAAHITPPALERSPAPILVGALVSIAAALVVAALVAAALVVRTFDGCDLVGLRLRVVIGARLGSGERRRRVAVAVIHRCRSLRRRRIPVISVHDSGHGAIDYRRRPIDGPVDDPMDGLVMMNDRAAACFGLSRTCEHKRRSTEADSNKLGVHFLSSLKKITTAEAPALIRAET
jgi:hypothetical protein